MRALLPRLVLLVLVGVLGAGVGWLMRSEPPGASAFPSAEAPAASDAAAFDSLESALRRTRARFERLRPPSAAEEYALRHPRTPSYLEHMEAARSSGIAPVPGEAAIARHLAEGTLVPLAETDAYAVQVLEHSAPFVTPALKGFLDALGGRFQGELAERGLPLYRFTITSALRTADLQSDLRQSNRNAASGTSTHEYGVSVDVVNFRYAYRPRAEDQLALSGSPLAPRLNAALEETYRAYGGLYWDHLFGLLTRLLRESQQAGDVLVLLEAEQPVFHLTMTP